MGNIAFTPRLSPVQVRHRPSGFPSVSGAHEDAEGTKKAPLPKWAVLISALFVVAIVGCAALTERANASIASCYGPGLWGNHTASGSILRRGTLGVAHKTLPFGTRLHIRAGGVTTTVKVIDRGPFVTGRTFDLTEATAGELGASSCAAWGHRSVRSWRAR